MGTAMYNQAVPSNWEGKCYPSLMPLAAWTNDLLRRLDFLNKWIEMGIPPTFWISGFFFPQAFLTGTLQNFARKYQKPIDEIAFDFKFLDEKKTDGSDVTEKAPDGAYL